MEHRRTTHQTVTSRVEYEVDPAVRPLPDEPVETDPAAAERLAELREKSLKHAVAVEEAAERRRAMGPLFRLVDLVFFLVYVALGIRLVLTLLNARPDAPFAQWIVRITDPLYAPFRGILPNLTTEAGFTVALPLLFALLVYGLLHAIIRRLLGVFAGPRTA